MARQEFEDQVSRARKAEAFRVDQENRATANLERERQEAFDIYEARAREAILECQRRLEQDPRNQEIVAFLQSERLVQAAKYIEENTWYQERDIDALRVDVQTVTSGGLFSRKTRQITKVSENAYVHLRTGVVRKPASVSIVLPQEQVSDMGADRARYTVRKGETIMGAAGGRYTVGKDETILEARNFFVLPTKIRESEGIQDYNPAYEYYRKEGSHFEFTDKVLQQMINMALVRGGHSDFLGGIRKYPDHYTRVSHEDDYSDYPRTYWSNEHIQAYDVQIGFGASAHWDPRSEQVIYLSQDLGQAPNIMGRRMARIKGRIKATTEDEFYDLLAQGVAKGLVTESHFGVDFEDRLRGNNLNEIGNILDR